MDPRGSTTGREEDGGDAQEEEEEDDEDTQMEKIPKKSDLYPHHHRNQSGLTQSGGNTNRAPARNPAAMPWVELGLHKVKKPKRS